MRRDEFPIVHMAIKDAVLKALEDVRAEIKAYQADAFYSDDVVINKRLVLEIINRKIEEIENESTRSEN